MVLLNVCVLEPQLLCTAPGSCSGVVAACTELPPSQGSALPSGAVLPSGAMALPKPPSDNK